MFRPISLVGMYFHGMPDGRQLAESESLLTEFSAQNERHLVARERYPVAR